MDNNDYEIVGTGKKKIVFIHYFGGDAGSWKWLAKRLAKTHTCILLNLPGFNGTELNTEPSIYGYANFVNDVIHKLKLKKYTLYGHSMGAKIGLYAALMNEKIKPEKIILIAPSPPTVENMPEDEKKRMLNHPDKDEAVTSVKNSIVRKLKPIKFSYAVDSQLRVNNTAWQWWIKTGMNHDISEAIENIEIPTFVICSKDDPAIAIDDIYNEVLPHLDKPNLTVLNRVGHLIPMEAPRKLARHIRHISKLKFKKSKEE
ncbi:alpha/beta hydrolase [Polaribacter sp.]|nr:alpha/beta hydrolase [Polaribacter sp.]